MIKFLRILAYPFKILWKALKYFFMNYEEIFIVHVAKLLLAFIGFTVVLFVFRNPKVDTTNLTNYGFAILAGISSICFSMVRNLNPEIEPNFVKKVSKMGEVSFHTGIIFLISSALKYSSLHVDFVIPKNFEILTGVVKYSTSFVSGFVLMFGEIRFFWAFSDLNRLLFRRIWLHKIE